MQLPHSVKRYLIGNWLMLRRACLWLRYRRSCPFPNRVRKILLARFDRLGDLVLSTAILPSLRRRFPAAEIHVAVSPGLSTLLQGHPLLDRVFAPVDARSVSRRRLARRLADAPADLGIDLTLTRNLNAANFLRQAGVRCLVGFAAFGRGPVYDLSLADPGFDQHFVDVLHGLVRQLPSAIRDFVTGEPSLSLTPGEESDQEDWLRGKGIRRPYLLCHPGAHYPSQRYPLPALAETLDLLRQRNIPLVIGGGPADGEWLQTLARRLTPGADLLFLPQLQLRELLRLSFAAQVFLGNNSGPLHLAAACGCPTVSTLGPTRPRYFRPRGDSHRVLSLSLSCSPCERSFCDHHRCLRGIPPAQLAQAVWEAWREREADRG